MALSQGLYQKQLQKLSPQQIQLMKLLQVPTAQLEERIKEELEENPALETGDEEEHEEFENDTTDEFEKEDEYDLDGSEDEYGNIDISEYVHDGDDDIVIGSLMLISSSWKMKFTSKQKDKPAFLLLLNQTNRN